MDYRPKYEKEKLKKKIQNIEQAMLNFVQSNIASETKSRKYNRKDWQIY